MESRLVCFVKDGTSFLQPAAVVQGGDFYYIPISGGCTEKVQGEIVPFSAAADKVYDWLFDLDSVYPYRQQLKKLVEIVELERRAEYVYQAHVQSIRIRPGAFITVNTGWYVGDCFVYSVETNGDVRVFPPMRALDPGKDKLVVRGREATIHALTAMGAQCIPGEEVPVPEYMGEMLSWFREVKTDKF
jgi:hypothetical protein